MSRSIGHHPSVAFLSTAGNIGGMERVVCNLAYEFAARDWPVRTLFPSTSDNTALLQWCRDQDVHAETSTAFLDAAAPHRWRNVRQLRDVLRHLDPDIVNLHYGDNFVSLKDVLAARLSGKRRCIVSVHHPTAWQNTIFKKRLMTRLASMLADEITTFSRATYTIMREIGVPTSKLHLIPCGVRAPQCLPERNAARKLLHIPEDAIVIGSLARLVPHKGIHELIEAVARIVDTVPNMLLIITGDGPERASLEALAARQLGQHVRFLGRVPDVNVFFAACDLFALPSHLEGFGLVYVEAAFHGIPSVGTRVGGIPDAVVDEHTGLLVPVGDGAALTCALRRLIANPVLRQQLGEHARARARAELSARSMADRFEDVFQGAHREVAHVT